MFDFKEFLLSNKNKVEEIQKGRDKLVVFGAGNTSRLYEKCFSDDGLKIAGFADNDARKYNKSFLGGVQCCACTRY